MLLDIIFVAFATLVGFSFGWAWRGRCDEMHCDCGAWPSDEEE